MQSKNKRIYYIISIVAILLILALLFNQSTWYKRYRYPLKYAEYIQKYSAEYSLESSLVASIIWVESRYQDNAMSPKGARGLMQIIPDTARWGADRIGLEEFDDDMLFDPETNIKIGCWFLNYLLAQFPYDLALVLASYNGGIGNVKKWLNNKDYSMDGVRLDHIPFTETRIYVTTVIETMEVYKNLYPDLQ
ncbi:MAG TPA: lytic transglycosylase domain-containing protein [Bacillota bacterium]|nr:lytic transglycosylase domain-containing protein [Bacillota bacterium]